MLGLLYLVRLSYKYNHSHFDKTMCIVFRMLSHLVALYSHVLSFPHIEFDLLILF